MGPPVRPHHVSPLAKNVNLNEVAGVMLQLIKEWYLSTIPTQPANLELFPQTTSYTILLQFISCTWLFVRYMTFQPFKLLRWVSIFAVSTYQPYSILPSQKTSYWAILQRTLPIYNHFVPPDIPRWKVVFRQLDLLYLGFSILVLEPKKPFGWERHAFKTTGLLHTK